MKRLSLALAGCLIAMVASAQTLKEGTVFINPSLTNLGFNSISVKASDETSSTSRLGLQARAGYALMDDLAIMAGLGYQSVSAEGTSVGFFNIAAGARKYFLVPGLYGGANLVYGTVNVNSKSSYNGYDDDDFDYYAGSGSNSTNGNTLGIEVNAGYSYFLSKHFAVEPSVSYMYGLSTKVSGQKIGLSVFSVNIGFIYKLDNVISFKK